VRVLAFELCGYTLWGPLRFDARARPCVCARVCAFPGGLCSCLRVLVCLLVLACLLACVLCVCAQRPVKPKGRSVTPEQKEEAVRAGICRDLVLPVDMQFMMSQEELKAFLKPPKVKAK